MATANMANMANMVTGKNMAMVTAMVTANKDDKRAKHYPVSSTGLLR